MRIIDKRKDFYDGTVLYSPDPVWIRKEDSFVLGDDNPYGLDKTTIETINDVIRGVPTPSTLSVGRSSFIGLDRSFGVVVFCGKAYIVYYKDPYLGRPKDIISADRPTRWMVKWNETRKDKSDHIHLDDGESLRYFRQHFNDKMWENWKQNHQDRPLWGDLHRVFKSPLWMVLPEGRHYTIIINPILNKVGFQCVLDPWTITQSLERYVGNDMVDTPLDGFEMSDELKRDSKGMDEWSFKQRGPKPRKQKKG